MLSVYMYWKLDIIGRLGVLPIMGVHPYKTNWLFSIGRFGILEN